MKEQGWLIEKKIWSRFASKDFWNCFDRIAIKDGKVVAVQIKYKDWRKQDVKAKWDPIKNHIPLDWACEIWRWTIRAKKNQGWEVFPMRDL